MTNQLRFVEGVGHATDGAASFDFSGAAKGGDTAGFLIFGDAFGAVLPSFSWWREREMVSKSMWPQINHMRLRITTKCPNNKVRQNVFD